MTNLLAQQRPVLKASEFSDRIASIFNDSLPSHPIPDLKYRRILIPGLAGGELHFCMLGLMGQAMRIRGALVTALCCDSLLPACAHHKVDHHELACRRWCHKNAGPFAQAMRLPHRWYSEFITDSQREQCRGIAASVSPGDMPAFQWHDIAMGDLLGQSVSSYFKVGYFDPHEPRMEAKAREYLLSGLYLAIITTRAIQDLDIDKVFIGCGLRIDWGVPRAVAAQLGVPLAAIEVSPRPNRFQFFIDHPGRSTVRAPEWNDWRNIPLTQQQQNSLDEYLHERERVPYLFKSEAWSNRVTDPSSARRLIGLPDRPTGKVFAMFPNVAFDIVASTGRPIFPTIAEWLRMTVRFFREHPSHHLIIKSHPGERHLDACDPVVSILHSQDANLPPNILLVGPDSPVTAHSLVRMADIALVYTSTVAVEAAALGIPVVMVGDGLHARTGIALEPGTPEEYWRLLDDLSTGRRTIDSPTELGRRYAYLYFFRSALYMRQVQFLDHEVVDLRFQSVEELSPGHDRTLDTICRGVLCDEPILNPEA
jgi:hypothetical protein